ncbi:hypothetical protein NDU88_006054 [Pleurodeles waltl]|uniref:Uncharacterized protein n=1 Tax=Pleurodeles waltl TaxID=8319 RepID=A0AAV7TC85_PLEWA|nr:hypothetical protein NDU88_006054 [Pleurodeles waltl]
MPPSMLRLLDIGAKARRSAGTSSSTRRRRRRRTLAYPDLDRTVGGKGEEQRAPKNGCRDTGLRLLTTPRPISGTAPEDKHIRHWSLIKPGRVDKGRSAAPLHYTH